MSRPRLRRLTTRLVEGLIDRPTATTYERMPQFGRAHWAMLGTTAATCAGFIAGARRVRDTQHEERARKAWGWTHLALGTAWTAAPLDPQQFDIRESLPLHLCDVLRPVLALGLITGNDKALALTYYWGLVLNPQAILTPDVIYYYYEPWALRFATYWFFHITALATPLALSFGLGYRPTWRDYRFAVAVTPAWMVTAMITNALTRGNYGFLNHAPGSTSVINLLGPWPGYIGAEIVGVAAAWAALTAAWR